MRVAVAEIPHEVISERDTTTRIARILMPTWIVERPTIYDFCCEKPSAAEGLFGRIGKLVGSVAFCVE